MSEKPYYTGPTLNNNIIISRPLADHFSDTVVFYPPAETRKATRPAYIPPMPDNERPLAMDGRHDTNDPGRSHPETSASREVRTLFQLNLFQELSSLKNNAGWLVEFQDLKARSAKNPAWPFQGFNQTEIGLATTGALRSAANVEKAVKTLREMEKDAEYHENMFAEVTVLKKERGNVVSESESQNDKCESDYAYQIKTADHMLQVQIPEIIKKIVSEDYVRVERFNTWTGSERMRILADTISKVESAYGFLAGREHDALKAYVSKEVTNRIFTNATRPYLHTNEYRQPHFAEKVVNEHITRARAQVTSVSEHHEILLRENEKAKQQQIEYLTSKIRSKAAVMKQEAVNNRNKDQTRIKKDCADKLVTIDANIQELEGMIDSKKLNLFPLDKNKKIFKDISPNFKYHMIRDFWEAKNIELYINSFQTDAIELPSIESIRRRGQPKEDQPKTVVDVDTIPERKVRITRRRFFAGLGAVAAAVAVGGAVHLNNEVSSSAETSLTEQAIPDWMMSSVSVWKPYLDQQKSDSRTQSRPVKIDGSEATRTFDTIKDHPKFIYALMAVTSGGNPSVQGGPLTISSADTEKYNTEYRISPGATSQHAWMNSFLLAQRSANDIFATIYSKNPQLVDNYAVNEDANLKDIATAFIELWNPESKLSTAAKNTFANICRSWGNKTNPIIQDILGDNASGSFFRKAKEAVDQAGVANYYK